jgi:hypothetical protein
MNPTILPQWQVWNWPWSSFMELSIQNVSKRIPQVIDSHISSWTIKERKLTLK